VKLKKIVLDNFRCFEHLEMDFDERLTVIVGGNGAGKTAVLDSIGFLFGRLLSRLPKISGIAPSLSDLKTLPHNKLAPAFRCKATVDVATELKVLRAKIPDDSQDTCLHWSLGRFRDKSPATKLAAFNKLRDAEIIGPNTPVSSSAFSSFKQIYWLADLLLDAESSSQTYRMPIVTHYGTGRAVFETPMRRRNFKTQFARFDSLADALEPRTNFKRVFEWFHVKENEELRELRENLDLNYRDSGLECIRRAITQFFDPHFKNPRTKLRPLRFVVDWKEGDHYIPLDLNQLSDGYRTTLALVADLARRMVEANPPGSGIDDPLNTEAIVLIDEVDLHLHPAWQQHILAQLQETFPKSQFIVTTHSPQVLSTVPAECIRVLHTATDPETQATRATVSTVKRQTLGVASSDVLAEVMGIDPVPDVEQARDLQSYHALIQQNLHETPDGLKLRDKLTAHFGVEHPAMLECDRLIRLQSFKRKLPARAE
jgi:predicted ATP-binding protein involved in virulence